MNESGSMSLRARINNFAKEKGIAPQLALQSFFAERFLARLEKSPYANNVVVKGGTLVSAILGVAQRTTLDLDTTVVGMHVDERAAVAIVEAIAATDAGDGIVFSRDGSAPSGIVKDDGYGGWTIGLVASFGSIRLPIGVDVTFGDVITPCAAERTFGSILDGSVSIRVLAYTVETLMAEKLQTVLKRGVATTRPRDFYDLHMLRLRGEFDLETLATAVRETFANRNSAEYLEKGRKTLSSISESEFQRRQWLRYQKKAPYAAAVSFDDAMASLAVLLELVESRPASPGD